MSAPMISAFGKYSASATHSSPVEHPKERIRRAFGCRGGGGGENHWVPIERGPVRPLVAAGMEQRGHLRELAALKVMKDAFSTHAAP